MEEALASQTPRLMGIPGVLGTGIGERDGQPCILIFVSKRTVALVRELPSSIDGYPARMEVVGEVRPLPPSDEP